MSALALTRCDAGGGTIPPTQQPADAGFFTSPSRKATRTRVYPSLVTGIDMKKHFYDILALIVTNSAIRPSNELIQPLRP